MKKFSLLLAIMLVVILTLSVVACTSNENGTNNDVTYSLDVVGESAVTVKVGETVDYTKYFKLTDSKGNNIAITNDMLSLASADTSKEGTFEVVCSYNNLSAKVTFTVVAESNNQPSTLEGAVAAAKKNGDWNYSFELTEVDGGETYVESYDVMGDNVKYTYVDEDDDTVTDYLVFDAMDDYFYYCVDDKEGDFIVIPMDDYWFDEYYIYMLILDLDKLNSDDFNQDGDKYVAKNANKTASNVLYETAEDYTWVELTVTLKDGKLDTIQGKLDDGYVATVKFTSFGDVEFETPDVSGSVVGYPAEFDSLDSVFTDAQLNVGEGELEYFSVGENAPFGFDKNGRGVQFTQKSGTAVIMSNGYVEDVTQVTVYVSTNSDKGMKVSVSVGDVPFITADEEVVVTLLRCENEEVVFTCPFAVTGVIEIDLIPNDSGKSMYISEVDVSAEGFVPKPTVDNDPELQKVLDSYADTSKWNFDSVLTIKEDGQEYSVDTFACLGDVTKYSYTYQGESYVDYYYYADEGWTVVCYYDLGNGKYQHVEESIFYTEAYFPEVYLECARDFEFKKVGDHYEAVDPDKCGEEIGGASYYLVEYTKVELYVDETNITKVVLYSIELDDDGETANWSYEFVFSGFGTVNFDLSALEIVYGEDVQNSEDFAKACEIYASEDGWNFGMDISLFVVGETAPRTSYGIAYVGDNCYSIEPTGTGEARNYLIYDEESESYLYYLDRCDGKYNLYVDNQNYVNAMYPISLYDLACIKFKDVGGGKYEAEMPELAGAALLGADEDVSYTKVEVTIEDGKVVSLLVYMDVYSEDEDGEYVISAYYSVAISGYGEMTFDTSVVDELSIYTTNVPEKVAENSKELTDAFEEFEEDKYNFSTTITIYDDSGKTLVEDYYKFMDNKVYNPYVDKNGDDDSIYFEFQQDNCYVYYIDEDLGKYVCEDYYSDAFEYFYFYVCYVVDPSVLPYFEFENVDGLYFAKNPEGVGLNFIGAISDAYFSEIVITLNDGLVANIQITFTDNYKIVVEFDDYGDIKFELPNINGENQTEDPSENSGFDYQGSFVDLYETYDSVSTFKNTSADVLNGQPEFNCNLTASSFSDERGMQFQQQNGEVVLTSKQSFDKVSVVTVMVQTNLGMDVSVKVGDVSLTRNGKTVVSVPQTERTSEVYILAVSFFSENPLSGNVVVTLTPQAKNKSMYISQIKIKEELTGGEANKDDEVMPNQEYNEQTFDNDRLQDKEMDVYEAIGMPSVGTYNVLVVPVQFNDESFTSEQLEKLEIAFNGTQEQTGWESVATYYQKSSNGKLNLTFDIQDVIQTEHNASYYDSINDEENGIYASDIILEEVMAALDGKIDFSKYDVNGDKCIDTIYLIYSHDYDDTSDVFWAYTSWYYPEIEDVEDEEVEPAAEELENDGEDDSIVPYTYIFASINFVNEYVLGADTHTQFYYSGLKVNANTFIHETGHALSLGDYYDCDAKKGCNLGLGGADMMDGNEGDQCAYSKIMLGWIDANIVTTTQTITIKDFQSSSDCILIPLDFNNSYFGEYLLIDLYTNTGLNALHAANEDTYLYGGEQYGVRIYHVSSSVNPDEPNDEDDYYELLMYDNSFTDFALIRLVEADGEVGFESSRGNADAYDLWQEGQTFSKEFKNYTRNDGKLINFDIKIIAVSATEATIQITFAE